MDSIIFKLHSCGYLKHRVDTDNSDFRELTNYLTSEITIWSYLIDPSIKDDFYTPNNYYFTMRDDLYFYITDERYIDADDPDNAEYPPTVVLLNTLYGFLVIFKNMAVKKIPKFTVTMQGKKRYVFTAEGLDPVIVDPDLGNLYNDTIPRIIARRINGVFEYDLCENNNPDDEDIHLFPQLLANNYPQDLFITLHEWPNVDTEIDRDKQLVIYDAIRISNSNHKLIDIVPAKRAGNNDKFFIMITKDSLKKFLQAWDTRLQFTDSFTLVFLGQTLRFFEGEPLI